MKKWLVTLLLLIVTTLTAFKAEGQTISQTYVDPCDNKVYVVTIPFGQNQTVVVIFPTSSIPPMMITGITAPAKIAVKPMILYQAATELSARATNSVRFENDKNLRRI